MREIGKLIKDVIGYDSTDDIEIHKWNAFTIINYAGSEYFVYDKSEDINLGNLIEYFKVNIDVTFILIYKNMRGMKDDINNSGKQKDIQLILENSITVFDSDKNLDIELEGFGENYLEYEDEYIATKQYKIKLMDLLNLYNNEGDNIFKANVRKGIHSNVQENILLKNSFKESFARGLVKSCLNYFGVTLPIEVEKKQFIEAIDIIIADVLKLDTNYDDISNRMEDRDYITNHISSFYYKHNGITIISNKKDGIIFKDKFITLNNKKIQVINGAQTITKWYDIVYEVDSKINSMQWSVDVKNLIEETKKEIYIKTSLLLPVAEEKDLNRLISEITLGLNTQVPVTNVDIFINSSEKVNELNILLKPYGIRIAKSGENSSNTVVIKYLVQSYYVFIGKPGAARNLSRDAVTKDETIEKIIDLFQKEEIKEKFIKFLQYQTQIESWWTKRNNLNKLTHLYFGCSEEDYEKQIKPFIANGLFLFKAYLIKCFFFEDVDLLDEDMDEILKKYLKDLIQIFRDKILEVDKSIVVDSNLFKGKDEYVFGKIEAAINKGAQGKIEFDDILCKEMQEKYFANETGGAKNKNYRFINEYLKSKGVLIDNIRTIVVKNRGVTESFPFSTNTFKDISISFNNSKDETFEESTFYREISKDYNLFLIDNDNEEIKHKKINFIEYLEDAKYIYNEVIESFKECDEDRLPSSSLGRGFHIRPKAINSNDVILFSYDKYITKRTFWANKTTMNTLLGLEKGISKNSIE
ncbi:hypothetical protein [Clostridium sp. UBA1652]|uniref:hypothetical protein n=1 Tax=Clostridium sp. UBA1652 TaxID=1946348 RepID=UPI00257BA7E2|nr:hypothetical protein [Clostridium sp. UBA1652]